MKKFYINFDNKRDWKRWWSPAATRETSWETFDFECPEYVKKIGATDNLISYDNIIK